MNKKINIIGAGIAGLSAGCYLQMNRYDTEIFEMNSLPGGLCTSWLRNGYTFDGCLHFVLGSNPKNVYYKLWNELIDMKKLEFVYYDYYSKYEDLNGNSLTFYCDVKKLKKELIAKAPEDKITINNYIKAIKKFSNFSGLPSKAQETYNFFDSVRITAKMIPFINSYKKWIGLYVNDFADFFKSKLLKDAFKVQPFEDMSIFFSLMMKSWLSKKNAGYPIGGSLKFSQLMENKYLELGGKINYRSKAEKITVKDNIAKGIVLENSDEYLSDMVISAADGHNTIYNMLEGKYADDKIQSVYKNYKPFPSYLQVSLGVKASLDKQPHLLKFALKNPIRIDEKTIYDYINVRIFNFDKTMAPMGKSSLYAIFATDNHTYWEYLRNNDKVRYQSEKDRIADEVIQALDKKFGNIKSNIEEVDVSTPATVIRYTNNWKGSYEGWLPTKKTGIRSIKKTLPGLDNFYMIGHWVEIGGGIPSALKSGRNVTQIICKKDKKKFITTHY